LEKEKKKKKGVFFSTRTFLLIEFGK